MQLLRLRLAIGAESLIEQIELATLPLLRQEGTRANGPEAKIRREARAPHGILEGLIVEPSLRLIGLASRDGGPDLRAIATKGTRERGLLVRLLDGLLALLGKEGIHLGAIRGQELLLGARVSREGRE